jgi:hypothetical protein
MLAAIAEPAHVWVAVAIIALWLVLIALKLLGQELDYAVRLHALKVETHALRQRQVKRLKELGIKRR